MVTNQAYNSKENHKQNKTKQNKKQPMEWEKIFANYMSNKSLISLVYK